MIDVWHIWWHYMERKKQFSDSFDQLIVNTLSEEMGAAPSDEVWLRIAKEINHSASPIIDEKQPSNEGQEWLFLFLGQPFLQRAAALFLLLVIIGNSILLFRPNDALVQVDPTLTSQANARFTSQKRPLPQSDWHIINDPLAAEYTKRRHFVRGERIIIRAGAPSSLSRLALSYTSARPK